MKANEHGSSPACSSPSIASFAPLTAGHGTAGDAEALAVALRILEALAAVSELSEAVQFPLTDRFRNPTESQVTKDRSDPSPTTAYRQKQRESAEKDAATFVRKVSTELDREEVLIDPRGRITIADLRETIADLRET